MYNLLTINDFLFENENPQFFTEEQINESLKYLECEDLELFEKWYNTLLDFAALIPVVGSIAAGINLVSYAKQGEYLLAGLCAIALIPLFGQYLGAGGTLLIKILGKGARLGKNILRPLINLIAKFFPRIVNFLKSPKFAAKFPGISPYINKMITSLKNFVMTNGAKLNDLAKNPQKIKQLKRDALKLQQGTKIIKWMLGGENKDKQIPVPKEAYLSYEGTPLKNIRPYSDMEISKAQQIKDWAEQYL